VGVSEVRALTAFHFEFSTASKMAACCVAESRRKAQGSAKCEEVYGIGGYSLAISTSLPMECVCVCVGVCGGCRCALSHNLGSWALASFW